uniref:Thioredoxin domain-containing protein 17 n=1 Tax=Canis lupus familiaris TaxID=9615 RepID=A0A8C0PSI3_CANLF
MQGNSGALMKPEACPHCSLTPGPMLGLERLPSCRCLHSQTHAHEHTLTAPVLPQGNYAAVNLLSQSSRISTDEPEELTAEGRCGCQVQMAGCEEVSVSGFEEFSRAVEQHHGKTIFAYFTGSKDAGGRSWCPDCVQAEPVVREGLKHISEGCVFIYCQVGERPYWKDPNNDFRKNLKVTAVPTLLKYGTPQKLVESECLQANLVEMLFSED